MTIKAGILGSPAKHSLSPVIHGAWLKAAGIDGVYDIYDLPRDGFAPCVAQVRGTVSGVNVTLPFKEEALAIADRVSDRARAAGAVNLLTFRNGEILGDNTDGYGLIAAFAEQAADWRAANGPVVVLGAGGASRGAVAALIEAGAPKVRIVNRTVARAQAIAEAVAGDVSAYRWEDFANACEGAGALVNATSLGLIGGEPLEIDLSLLPAGAPVMDMVYRPLITPLLQQAQAQGRTIIDGLAMLIGQARPSFEAFYGEPPPDGVDVRDLSLKAMGQ